MAIEPVQLTTSRDHRQSRPSHLVALERGTPKKETVFNSQARAARALKILIFLGVLAIALVLSLTFGYGLLTFFLRTVAVLFTMTIALFAIALGIRTIRGK